MIVIEYSEKDAITVAEWKERMDNWVIAYRLDRNDELTETVLTEGQATVKGNDNINAYLKNVEELVSEWRAPKCGV